MVREISWYTVRLCEVKISGKGQPDSTAIISYNLPELGCSSLEQAQNYVLENTKKLKPGSLNYYEVIKHTFGTPARFVPGEPEFIIENTKDKE